LPGIDKGGPYGCSLSHIHAVTKVLKESKDDYILVCEDDAIPITQFDRRHFEQVMKWAEENKEKWDIIHFGPSDVDGYSIVTPYLCKANICMATHFMCYSRSMIKVFEEWDKKLKEIG